jgi:hypothetical protein
MKIPFPAKSFVRWTSLIFPGNLTLPGTMGRGFVFPFGKCNGTCPTPIFLYVRKKIILFISAKK